MGGRDMTIQAERPSSDMSGSPVKSEYPPMSIDALDEPVSATKPKGGRERVEMSKETARTHGEPRRRPLHAPPVLVALLRPHVFEAFLRSL